MKLSEAEGIFTGAMALMATLAAYFASPLLPYADAGQLASVGLCLGAGAAGSWLGLRLGFDRLWKRVCLTLAAVGFAGVVWQLLVAQVTYSANLRRCLQLQDDMLSAAPKRPDSPDIFAALGCRAQGGRLVSFAPKPNVSSLPRPGE